jgi:hypothetical protein
MATTITWNIDSLSTSTQVINGFSEVVLQAAWRCTGTDGTNTASNYGSVGINEPQPNDPNFIPFAQLTQAEVLGWIWETVNQADVEASVTAQVANLANPPVINLPLPWA